MLLHTKLSKIFSLKFTILYKKKFRNYLHTLYGEQICAFEKQTNKYVLFALNWGDSNFPQFD